MTLKLLALSMALILAGCGAGEDTQAMEAANEQAQNDMGHSEMDHGDPGMETMSGSQTTEMEAVRSDTGTATGIIRSVGDLSDFVTIDHEAIDGVGMGAMTMGFSAMSGVDLSEFGKGDRVAFSVKRGRDGSYRITGICKTEGADQSCLNQ